MNGGLKFVHNQGQVKETYHKLNRSRKKITQTEPATSENPIQKATVLLEYDIIVLFVFFNGVLVN